MTPLFLSASQPSPVRLESSWRCPRSSARPVQPAPTLWAAASGLTNGTPSLQASPAWPASWTRGQTARTFRHATGDTDMSSSHRNMEVSVDASQLLFSTDVLLCCGCSSSWTPQGVYLESNRDECTVSLVYAVHLEKQGSVSFTYQYPDNNIFFEFYVRPCDSCHISSTHLETSCDDESLCSRVFRSRMNSVRRWPRLTTRSGLKSPAMESGTHTR